MPRTWLRAVAASLGCTGWIGCVAAGSSAATHPPAAAQMPRYAHILVIVAENKGYDLILGPGTVAPNISRLAQRYGLASQFFAEVHPSEGNYVAMLGGDTFGIHDDDAYYCRPGLQDRFCPKAGKEGYVDHTVSTVSLADQLESHGLTWKAYMESIPNPGSDAARWPTRDKPVPGLPPELYAVKHNGFMT